MPEETGRVVAVQAEVQYQPAEIARQSVRIGPEPEGREGPEGPETPEEPESSAVLPWYTSPTPGETLPDGTGRLLVVVHGALRDAGRYLEHAQAAAREHASRSLIVAPQFLADVDLRGGPEPWPGTLYWDAEGWKGGEQALGTACLSSFTVMDRLLGQLTTADSWPSGRPPAVVVYGNSAGGQYVNRYAAVGRGPDRLAARGVAVRFVLSNPSTYLYFTADQSAAVGGRGRGDGGEYRWRYGFDGAPAYVEGDARENLRRYLGRDVTIVLGRDDSDGASLLLETHAAAMAQGANRYDRGIRYHAYITRLAREEGLEPRHQLIECDGVGHAAADVMAAEPVRDILFG
jgi:hypothetical protein